MSWFLYSEQRLSGSWTKNETLYNGHPFFKHDNDELYMGFENGYWKVQDELGAAGSYIFVKSSGSCPAAERYKWTFWDETHQEMVTIDNELLFQQAGRIFSVFP